VSEPVRELPELPEVSADDTDLGWGERVSESDPDDLDRFLADRPPHHGDV
jgi:hypothetical protein